MVIFNKKKCKTLFSASELLLKNSRTLKTAGAVGWDLWSKSIQVWESRLSFGCMRKGPWQSSLYPLLFSCTSPPPYNTINTSNRLVKPFKPHTLFQKTHSNKVEGSLVCFNTTFTNISLMATFTAPPKKIHNPYILKKPKSVYPLQLIDICRSANQILSTNQNNNQTGSNQFISVTLATTTTTTTTNSINYTTTSETTKTIAASRKEPVIRYSPNGGTLVVIVFLFKRFCSLFDNCSSCSFLFLFLFFISNH